MTTQRNQLLHWALFVLTVLVSGNGSADAAQPSRIYRHRINGDGAVLQLVADENTVPGREFLGSPAASHDGNWVLFDATKGRAFSKTRLIKVAIAGPQKGKVVDLGYGVCGSFSPKDERITFFLNNNCPSGEQRGVWVMNADGTDRERIGSGCHPKWSPDGSRILAVSRFLSPRNLTSIDLKTGKQNRLLKNETVLGLPTWSPDGEHLAVTVEDGGDRVLCVFKPQSEPADRKELWRGAFSQEFDETWPSWSQDGKSIVFTTWDESATKILSVDVATDPIGKPREVDIAAKSETIRDCCWTADGKGIFFASASEAIHRQSRTPKE